MKETLLIVDDSIFETEILKSIMTENFNIIEAADGEECLKILEQQGDNIDLIFLDLVMPKIDGMEVLKICKSDDRYKDIPVIMLTASEHKSDQIEAFQFGANDYIHKPFDKVVVQSRANNVMAVRRRYHSVMKEAERFRIKAEMDEMTGLYNKTTTVKMIQEHLSASADRICAMMLIDIDNFKTVNDVEGHQMGDHTICVVADMLSNCFRKTDIVGRIGGDEFLVLMMDISSPADARHKASELVTIMKYKTNFSIPEYISLSIGLSICENEDVTYEEMFRRGDEAMYESKRAGKGRYTEYGHSGLAVKEYESSVVLLTQNRSICSQIESSMGENYKLDCFDDVESVYDLSVSDAEGKIAAFFIDISQSSDNGASIIRSVNKKYQEIQCSVYVICAEENLMQYQNALACRGIKDLFTPPLDIAKLRRKLEK